jgi:hypothetical protein
MRKFIITIVFFFYYLSFSHASNIEIDILQEELLQQLQGSQYYKSINTIEKIEHISPDIPLSLFFYKGMAYYELGDPEKALSILTTYAEATGKSGRYYKEAISYIVKSREVIEQVKANNKRQDEIDAAEKRRKEEAEKRHAETFAAEKKRITEKKNVEEQKKHNKIIENLIKRQRYCDSLYSIQDECIDFALAYNECRSNVLNKGDNFSRLKKCAKKSISNSPDECAVAKDFIGYKHVDGNLKQAVWDVCNYK